LPSTKNPEQPVFFVEVQFQKDEQLYHRLFAELFLFLKHNPKTVAWKAVVFFAKR
jgi:predicted transposase YdaD